MNLRFGLVGVLSVISLPAITCPAGAAPTFTCQDSPNGWASWSVTADGHQLAQGDSSTSCAAYGPDGTLLELDGVTATLNGTTVQGGRAELSPCLNAGDCIEILPGLTVATSDAPAVAAYLAAIAPAVDERLTPALDWPVWDQIAQCESGGRWTIQGRRYGGGLQILTSTWRSHGGREFARLPSGATREQQIVVARRILASGGWSQWPGCSEALDLT